MTNQTTFLAETSPSRTNPTVPHAMSRQSSRVPPNPMAEVARAVSRGRASRPEPILLEHLIQITLRLRLSGADIESSTGLSGRELDLVALLSTAGPTSVKSLVADLGLPRSTMTAVVDRLEARGLVKRLPNLEDRRSVILEATPTALEALVKYREGIRGFVEHLKGVLNGEEERQLIRLIEKIAGSL
jgi:DNA-binding MarR family transcriptional regulator